MRHALRQLGFNLQIYWLMLFNAAALFRRLNNIDWYRQTLNEWTDSLQLQPEASVLEIGCATGELSERLAASGVRITAVDSSERMLASAQAESAGKVNYLAGSITNLPFTDNSFDAVISASVVNVVDDKQKALAEMFRVCKPGGQVSFLVPVEGFNRAQLEGLIKKLGISDFSEACLRTWHRAANKMSAGESELLISQGASKLPAISFYLDGKVLCVTAEN